MPFRKINKRLIIFISLFFFLNIGILYIYIHRIDRRYSTLLEKELENFKYIQRITEGSNKSFFILSKILDTKDSIAVEKLKEDRLFLVDQNTRYYDSIVSGTIVDVKSKNEYSDIVEIRKHIFKAVDQYYILLKTVSNDSCQKYFYNVITPNYLNYQRKLELFTDSHAKDLHTYSQNISTDIKKNSRKVLLFGFSPLLLVIISGVIYLFLIVVAIFLFKWKPIEFD